MPDRVQYFQFLPEWLKGIAAILTAGGTALVSYVTYSSWKKKKKASESMHAKSFKNAEIRDEKVDEIINTMGAAIPHSGVISISQWKNGDLPKEFRIIRSTDFNTWVLWKNYQIAEPDLVRVQATTLEEGSCLFRPSQMKDPVTTEWYEGNNILQTTAYLIAVNDLKNESLVMYINYDQEHILSAETRKLIRLYVGQLYKLYEPNGWLSKKNYLKN